MRNIIILSLLMWSCLLSAQDKLNILASASMWDDMTRQIVGDRATVNTIVPIGADPHTYEPTPSDAKMVSNADLILINALTFEGWINDLIVNSGTNAEVLTITKYIDPIRSDTYHNATDPHAWMDASNGLLYIKAIYEQVIKMDPKNADYYTANYEKYKKKIEQLHTYIGMSIESIPQERRILITSHDAFKYFGKAYGVKLEAIQGISTEAEAQSSDMQRVVDAIKKYNVPAIFIESTINPKMLKQIAKDNGVKIGGQLYADSLGDKDTEGGTYYGMLKSNTDVIVTALRATYEEQEHTESTATSAMWYWVLGLALLVILGVVFYKLR